MKRKKKPRSELLRPKVSRSDRCYTCQLDTVDEITKVVREWLSLKGNPQRLKLYGRPSDRNSLYGLLCQDYGLTVGYQSFTLHMEKHEGIVLNRES